MITNRFGLGAALLLIGCGTTTSVDGGVGIDSGSVDAGTVVDAGIIVDAGPVDAGVVDSGPVDAGPVDAGLTWFNTCGDVVCHPPQDGGPDAGPEDAGCDAVGTNCSTMGEMCGNPNYNCGVVEVCAATNPVDHGCPVSSREYKRDIEYLDKASLSRLHDETLGLRLATYHYKPAVMQSDAEHLGFIIEDDPTSPAVDALHRRVDMYGYLSMLVATMQVQEQEIAQLRKDLEKAHTNQCPAK